MQIILISDRPGKVRTLALSRRHVALSAALTLAAVAALTAVLYWASMRFAVEFKVPAIRELLQATEKRESERAREFMQQNLNAMAVKLGEMQAQLTRLDALGERLSTLAGVLPQEFRFAEPPGLGVPWRRASRRMTSRSRSSTRGSRRFPSTSRIAATCLACSKPSCSCRP